MGAAADLRLLPHNLWDGHEKSYRSVFNNHIQRYIEWPCLLASIREAPKAGTDQPTLKNDVALLSIQEERNIVGALYHKL